MSEATELTLSLCPNWHVQVGKETACVSRYGELSARVELHEKSSSSETRLE